MRRASFFLVAIFLATGCGGGGGGKPLTRDEYATKADAICAKYTQQTKALANPSNLSDLANVADKTLPILDHAISDLRKLKPPADVVPQATQHNQQSNQLATQLGMKTCNND